MDNKYPECDKMLAVKDKSQVIGEFLEWLQCVKEIELCQLIDGEEEMEYSPIYFSNEELLAEFFNIDLDKVEKEKLCILDELNRNK